VLHIQELCGVRVCWLKPGQLCFESVLGVNDYTPPDVVAYTHSHGLPAFRRLDDEALLAELLAGNQRSVKGCWTGDHLVQMLAPVTVFEFEPFETKDALLAEVLRESGARSLFASYLDELEQLALGLRHAGQAVDRKSWGTWIYMHSLWVYEMGPSTTGNLQGLRLAGQVDLYRLPLAMFVENCVRTSPKKLLLQMKSLPGH